MSEIRIKPVTPVHVGSGRILMLNNDFCITNDSDGYDVVAVTDPQKILSLIGFENVDRWVSGIERNTPISEIIKAYAPKGTVVEDYSRIIDYYGSNNGRTTTTLKEFIHDGLGRPYIPGSSIKGAIRTAVMSSIVNGMPNEKIKVFNRNNRIDDKVMSGNIFGGDPKTDVFRFLIVRDAFFGEYNTIAFNMVNINERERHSFWDTSKSQLVEALSVNDESKFDIKLDLEKYNFSRNKVHILPECMKSLPALFSTINSHTSNLLHSEIKYWKEKSDEDESGKVDKYIEECERVLGKVEACMGANDSCVLRIGHGSGWRFITGAWSERSADFDRVINAARPHNNRYQDYSFPKSRRVSQDCELLGFVKLTIMPEQTKK